MQKNTTHTVDITNLAIPELVFLRELFVSNGFDLRFVGGCVRDTLLGIVPNDVDLHTDANPQEQVSIYRAAGVYYIETGLQHGTLTVLLNDKTYEITSLRQDTETDGRHATVVYTRDWQTDCQRRDFTINAMSIGFDGDLMDPFNGQHDLQNGLVAFVGDPAQRIKEDYLRILRWFRFRGRFGMSMSYSARRAVEELASGLANISRERVWSEVSKIISGNDGPFIMLEMHSVGVADFINLQNTSTNIVEAQEVHAITKNPVTLMVSMYEGEAIRVLNTWKASSAEQDLAVFLSMEWQSNISPHNWMAVSGISREWALELAALRGMDAFDRAVLETWEVPVFPVSGNDIIELGVKQGPIIGEILHKLKSQWAAHSYTLTKQDLLRGIVSN